MESGTEAVQERTAAEALRVAMERRGLTYRALAERAGMPTTSTHKMLTRVRDGSAHSGMNETSIARLCKAMDCGLRYRPGDGWHATE